MSDQQQASVLNRYTHVVINVTDLERSIDFYSATLPLTPVRRFEVRNQPLDHLGVARGSLRGCVMGGTEVQDAVEVHLVQWLDPAPAAVAPRDFNAPGLYRICFQSPRVESRYEDVLRHNGRPFTELQMPYPGRTTGRPVFGFRDPDGTVIEYVTFEAPERTYHVNHNSPDLGRISTELQDVLGMQCPILFESDKPGPCPFTESAEETLVKAGLYSIPTREGREPSAEFVLDVCEWLTPPTTGRVSYAQTTTGLARVGIEVDSLADVEPVLKGLPDAIVSPRTELDLGEDVPQRVLTATLFDGLVLEFVERGRS
ncbi:MAG TPA: VOC family protein [Jatrophihabitans sp.]|jgi:catechol 2,3-dioxygenase-like lactoylglutathione lyase family enzyme